MTIVFDREVIEAWLRWPEPTIEYKTMSEVIKDPLIPRRLIAKLWWSGYARQYIYHNLTLEWYAEPHPIVQVWRFVMFCLKNPGWVFERIREKVKH